MTTTRDILALIVSWTPMLDQLLAQVVCREWKMMIERHPFLLRNIDFGDPQRFPSVAKIDSILSKAGNRVRCLRICPPLNSEFKQFSLHNLVQKVVKDLQHLILVGHVPGDNMQNFWFPAIGMEHLLPVLKTSNAATLQLTFETCSCNLRWVRECITTANKEQKGAILSLETPLCHLIADFICPLERHMGQMCTQWTRKCSQCEFVCCENCSYSWEWCGELATRGIQTRCHCMECLFRATVPKTPLSPPLWSCISHCHQHTVYKQTK